MKTTFIFLLIFLTGCIARIEYTAPEMPTQNNWNSPQTIEMVQDDPTYLEWWCLFNDSTLDSLIGQAVENNLDLKIAFARMLEARALRHISWAEFFPFINLHADYSDNYFTAQGLGPGLGPVPVTPNIPVTDLKRHFNVYDVGFDAEWEIDVFGRISSQYEIFQGKLEASCENIRDVRVSLIAEVAKNYIQLRFNQIQKDILETWRDVVKDSLALNQSLYEAGKIDALDQLEAEKEYEEISAKIPPTEHDIFLNLYRIEVLLGYLPGSLKWLLCDPHTPELCMLSISLGLPSELLQRRPDIRKAERELYAANAGIAEAITQFYPHFFLLGNVGDANTVLRHLFTSASNLYGISPFMVLPLFNAGALMANVKLNRAQTEAAVRNYQKAVLNAFEEVEGEIDAFTKQKERVNALENIYQKNNQIAILVQQQYDAGHVNLLDLINARIHLYESKLDVEKGKLSLAVHFIALYKALGGGWTLNQK